MILSQRRSIIGVTIRIACVVASVDSTYRRPPKDNRKQILRQQTNHSLLRKVSSVRSRLRRQERADGLAACPLRIGLHTRDDGANEIDRDIVKSSYRRVNPLHCARKSRLGWVLGVEEVDVEILDTVAAAEVL